MIECGHSVVCRYFLTAYCRPCEHWIQPQSSSPPSAGSTTPWPLPTDLQNAEYALGHTKRDANQARRIAAVLRPGRERRAVRHEMRLNLSAIPREGILQDRALLDGK